MYNTALITSCIGSYEFVGDLKQFQHHVGGTHVPQQPLLVFLGLPDPRLRGLLDTESGQPQQDLEQRETIYYITLHYIVWST